MFDFFKKLFKEETYGNLVYGKDVFQLMELIKKSLDQSVNDPNPSYVKDMPMVKSIRYVAFPMGKHTAMSVVYTTHTGVIVESSIVRTATPYDIVEGRSSANSRLISSLVMAVI